MGRVDVWAEGREGGFRELETYAASAEAWGEYD